MTFKTVTSYPQNIDTIVNFFHYDKKPSFMNETIQAAFDAAFGGDSFECKSGDIKTLRMKLSDSFVNVILVAFDLESSGKGLDAFRKTTLKLGTKLNELKAENVLIDNLETLIFANTAVIACQFASTLPLCDYAFDKYKEKKVDNAEKEIYVYANDCVENHVNSALSEGVNLAKAICIARDLTNEPSDVLTPSELADRTAAYGKEYGFEVEIFDKDACEELGMKAFLTVARGSAYEPKLILMRYYGAPDMTDSENPLSMGIIGKGLCYDSGGLYLKPGASMEHSKADMAGGAAVIGAMCAIAMNKVQKNVVAVVAACENMLDGNGYRNGDIVHTMAGKNVFVGSTDAEGRLTLADAITYMVRHENIDSIIELSTLTGSCANFFGDVCCGVLTTDDELYSKLSNCSDCSGEKYWRIPHFDEFREFIKSDIADLHNTSTGGAGGICAGLFLDEFKEDKPFIHLDVAGMTFTKKKRDGYPKGGTGYGVKTVYHYIKN